uniref:Reverse transcriptase domain-containing protein n=1 Tax=Tanacetum cinerariifolium TaxID=118510 RepID=A0A6L2L8K9_TANCI|nr:hypothetical protein [Tanacetum cinerariifolium]
MRTRSGPYPTTPTSAVRNTIGQGKEISQGNLNGPASDAALREYCDKHYNQLLPILLRKCTKRRDLRKRLGSRRIRSVYGSPEPRRDRSESPRKRDPKRKTVFKRLEKGVFHRTEVLSESKGSAGRHWKSRPKKKRSSIKDDLSQPWVCEETDSFTPRIRYFDLPKRTCMPSHVKTYDGSKDPEDHLMIFQAVAKVKRWAMQIWCHMFNSTLTGSARKKCIKDPVKIHHIKQREGESTKDFVRSFKVESMDVKGATEIMRISGFMHGITNPELIKRLHDKISKSVDEMMRITTSFLRGGGGSWQPRAEEVNSAMKTIRG